MIAAHELGTYNSPSYHAKLTAWVEQAPLWLVFWLWHDFVKDEVEQEYDLIDKLEHRLVNEGVLA